MNTKIKIKLLSAIVLNPRKYDHVINVPGRFDAAEYLFKNHLQDVSKKVFDTIEQVLLNSGNYKKIPTS